MAEKNRQDHYRISPTAKLVAYFRANSDVPYSQEIATLIDAESAARQLLGDKIDSVVPLAAPSLEVRYKSINRGLEKEGCKNILELAMGLLPRGLCLTENPGITYVGTDLPEILSESSEVMKEIMKRQGVKRNNLYFQPANALNLGELEKAAKRFEGEKFVVCNEGLLMYLNRDEQTKLAQNVRSLLLPRGGVWITPDVSDNESREKMLGAFGKEFRKMAEQLILGISQKTGSNLNDNNFENEAEAEKFYKSAGFRIEKLPFYDGSYKLSTLNGAPKELEESIYKMLSTKKLWIMRPV